MVFRGLAGWLGEEGISASSSCHCRPPGGNKPAMVSAARGPDHSPLLRDRPVARILTSDAALVPEQVVSSFLAARMTWGRYNGCDDTRSRATFTNDGP